MVKTPYDYLSLMHYSNTSDSAKDPSKPVMEAIFTWPQNPLLTKMVGFHNAFGENSQKLSLLTSRIVLPFNSLRQNIRLMLFSTLMYQFSLNFQNTLIHYSLHFILLKGFVFQILIHFV